MNDEVEPKVYVVRFSREAEQNVISAAHDRLEFEGNPNAAQALLRSFYDEATLLRTFPHRFPHTIHESRQIGLPLRRRNVGKWAIFYTISEETDDGPLVVILFLWPSASEPITQEQGRQILENQ